MTSSNGNIVRVTGHLCGEFTGEFPARRPVTRSFDVFFDLRLNKRLSKQWWGWRFEAPSRLLWRHCILYCIWHLNTCFFVEILLKCGPTCALSKMTIRQHQLNACLMPSHYSAQPILQIVSSRRRLDIDPRKNVESISNRRRSKELSYLGMVIYFTDIYKDFGGKKTPGIAGRHE